MHSELYVSALPALLQGTKACPQDLCQALDVDALRLLSVNIDTNGVYALGKRRRI